MVLFVPTRRADSLREKSRGSHGAVIADAPIMEKSRYTECRSHLWALYLGTAWTLLWNFTPKRFEYIKE
jgi:hypothetical protein